MRVLIVDDSKAMRMIVKRELRTAAEVDEVVEADSAVAAVEVLRSQAVDLVLSDWNMPEMTGIELLEWLRAQGWTGELGFVTSEVGESSRVRAFAAGAAFVVAKPFQGGTLAEQIALALGRAPASAAAPVGADAGGDEGPSVASVLEGLLRRPVTVVPADPPRLEVARALARYVGRDGRPAAVCVAEISFAASAGAALSMLPADTAAEWAQAGALTAALAQNFHEVANVLAPVVRPDQMRCTLSEVVVLASLERLPRDEPLTTGEQVNVEVRIDGYAPGRVAFLCPAGVAATSGAGA